MRDDRRMPEAHHLWLLGGHEPEDGARDAWSRRAGCHPRRRLQHGADRSRGSRSTRAVGARRTRRAAASRPLRRILGAGLEVAGKARRVDELARDKRAVRTNELLWRLPDLQLDVVDVAKVRFRPEKAPRYDE